MAVKLLCWQERFHSIIQQVTVLFYLVLIFMGQNADKYQIGHSDKATFLSDFVGHSFIISILYSNSI
jgi:hypothetical protein